MAIVQSSIPGLGLDPMQPIGYRVAHRIHETPDTTTLVLRPAGEESIGPFKPGQFNMLYAFGVGEVPISISGDAGEPGEIVHTTRMVGAVSKAICALDTGDWVGVRGPFGSTWPLKESVGRDLLIVAGGIGLAPLRPMVYEVVRNRERFGEVSLLVGGRKPSALLYRSEWGHWRDHADIDLLATVDSADGGWDGDVGVVTRLIPRAQFDPVNTIAMICGPEIMMRYCARDLIQAGVPEKQIYLTLERNMKCGIGLCGHCQYGGAFMCKDGPVFSFDRIKHRFYTPEI